MAMVNPTKPEDLLLLIQEVNSELDNLLEHLRIAERNCAKSQHIA